MDKKSSSIKWITSTLVVVATVIGVYYFYKNKNKNNQTSNNMKFVEKFADQTDTQTNEVNKNVLQEKRDEALLIKKKGNEFFSLNDFENALKQYDMAINICPSQFIRDHAVFYRNKALALNRLENNAQALIEVNKALEILPQYKTAFDTRSKIFETLGKLQEALFDITAAVTFDSTDKSDSVDRMDNIVKNIAIERVGKEIMKEPMLRSEMDIKAYFKTFINDPFSNYLNIDLQDSESTPYFSRCIKWFIAGQYSACFKEVQEILQTIDEIDSKTISQLHLLRGTFYLLSCREELALKDFSRVLENPNSNSSEKVNAIIKRATILLTENNSLNTEEVFKEAVNINPNCADIYYHRGLFHEQLEQYKAAIDDFQNVLQLDSEHLLATVHYVFNEYWLIYSQQEKSCFAEFENLMRTYPNCIEVQQMYVKVLMDAGRCDLAENLSEKLLLIEPDSGSIMTFIADIKLLFNKLQEATSILKRAIEKDPKHAESYYSLAVIFIKNGELEKAIEMLEEAIKYAKNRQLMRKYIEVKEGFAAQLNVSRTFDIPIKDVIRHVSQGKI